MAKRQSEPRLRKTDSQATRFFWKHAGYVVGRRAESAREMARAEAYAMEHCWSVEWEEDDINDTSWCERCEADEAGHEHQLYVAVLKSGAGDIIDVLGGIDLAPNKDQPGTFGDAHGYCRVVNAELADNALHEIEQRAANDREAERIMAL